LRKPVGLSFEAAPLHRPGVNHLDPKQPHQTTHLVDRPEQPRVDIVDLDECDGLLVLLSPGASFGSMDAGPARAYAGAKMTDQLVDQSAPPGFSEAWRFDGVDWNVVPDGPGAYIIYDVDDILYVGMAGRNGSGSLRKRLKDHSSGQVVNMFAQYLFLARVQFKSAARITHPRAAKSACRAYILERCSFRFRELGSASEARELESRLKHELRPALNSPDNDA